MVDKRKVGGYGVPRGDEDGGPQREDQDEAMGLTYSNINGPEGQEVRHYFGNRNNNDVLDDIILLDDNDGLDVNDEGSDDLPVGAEANQINRDGSLFNSDFGDDLEGMTRRCEHLELNQKSNQAIISEITVQNRELQSENKNLRQEKEQLTKENQQLRGQVLRLKRMCNDMAKRADYSGKQLSGSEAAAVGGQQNGGVGVAVSTAAGGPATGTGQVQQPRLQNSQGPSLVVRPALPSQEPTPSTSRQSMGPPVVQAPRPPRPSSYLAAAAAASLPQQQPIASTTSRIVMGPPAAPAPKARPFGQPGIARPSMYGPPLAIRGPALLRPRFGATGLSAPRFTSPAPFRSGPLTVERLLSLQRQAVGRPTLAMTDRPMPKSVKERVLAREAIAAAASASQQPVAIASTSAQALARQREEDAAMNAAQTNASSSSSSDQRPIVNGTINQEATSPPPAPGSCNNPRTRKVLKKKINIKISGKPRGRPRKITKISVRATRTTRTTESQAPQGSTDPEPQFNCHLCEKRFHHLCFLRQHLKNVHKLEDKDLQHLKGFGCGRCGGIFPTNHELYVHMVQVHGGRKRKLATSGKPVIKVKRLKTCGRRGGAHVPPARKLAKRKGSRPVTRSASKPANGKKGRALPNRAAKNKASRGASQPSKKTTEKRGRRVQDGPVLPRILVEAVELSEPVIANPPPAVNPSPQANPPLANQEPLPEHYLVVSRVDDKANGSGYFKCICGKIMKNKHTAYTHVTRKNNGKLFKCVICGVAVVAHNVLKTHYTRIHNKTYDFCPIACAKCGLICFDTMTELYEHRKECAKTQITD